MVTAGSIDPASGVGATMSRFTTPAAATAVASTHAVTSSCWQKVTYLVLLKCMRQRSGVG